MSKVLSYLIFFSLIALAVSSASANIEINSRGIKIRIVCTADIENTSTNYTIQYKTLTRNITKVEFNGEEPMLDIGDKVFINQTVMGTCKVYIRIACNNITVEQYGLHFFLMYIPLRTIIS